MGDVKNISEAEYQVMKVIWEHAPVSTNEVVARLQEITAWKPKTIQTLLARLTKKEAVTYEKKGRVFVYTPLLQEVELLEQESDTFLNRFYNGTLNSMVVNFIEQDRLTEADIEELLLILETKRSEGQ
jgi:Predicted transcriptional regulator